MSLGPRDLALDFGSKVSPELDLVLSTTGLASFHTPLSLACPTGKGERSSSVRKSLFQQLFTGPKIFDSSS